MEKERKNKRNKLQRSKGITLVALIVTIIILLILAGISIATLTGSGLFEKAKMAEQESKNAIKKEEAILGEYEQLINNNRENITISKDELQKLVNQMVDEKISGASSNPAGTVISYIAGSTAPNGYLACDGTQYNISDYPVLAEAIKIGLGSYNYYGGDGETTFAVPDLRGEFLRGTGTAIRNSGSGGNVGTHQDATESPYVYCWGNLIGMYTSKNTANDFNTRAKNMDKITETQQYYYCVSSSAMSQTTGNGTYTSRPTNTSVLYCIKY